MSLPSPPHPSLMPSLPTTPNLPSSQIEALRSSVGTALNAISELQGLISWGGDEGVVGWPQILSSYQNLLSLLGLIAHHLNPPPPPPSTIAQSTSQPQAHPNPLAQLLVHPSLPSDQASEPWLQALLSLSQSIHSPPPPPPPTGTPQEHLHRIERAARVCSLLEENHDWRGRVGVVSDPTDGEEGEDGDKGSEEGEEDMFGSEPSEDGKGGDEGGKGGEREEGMGREERGRELKGLVGFMGSGGTGSGTGTVVAAG